MTRIFVSASLAAALAACATAGTPAASRESGDNEQKRTTTYVTTVLSSGQTVTVPVTTYSEVGGRTMEVDAAPQAVFQVLGDAYRDVGIEVKTIDAPKMTAGNTQVQARRRLGNSSISAYLDCGQTGLSGPAADVYPVRMSVLSTVVPSGTTSRLSTVVQAVFATAEQSGTTPCTSTGTLEATIARAVQLRLVRR